MECVLNVFWIFLSFGKKFILNVYIFGKILFPIFNFSKNISLDVFIKLLLCKNLTMYLVFPVASLAFPFSASISVNERLMILSFLAIVFLLILSFQMILWYHKILSVTLIDFLDLYKHCFKIDRCCQIMCQQPFISFLITYPNYVSPCPFELM